MSTEVSQVTNNKCDKENCNEEGKLKCSACGLVNYCSQTCQKSHWNSHKIFCKANRKSSVPSMPKNLNTTTNNITQLTPPKINIFQLHSILLCQHQ
jgi:hypothetical protein